MDAGLDYEYNLLPNISVGELQMIYCCSCFWKFLDIEYFEADCMKTIILICVIAFIMLFVAGCGPGQPFEIEGRHAPQSAMTMFSAAK